MKWGFREEAGESLGVGSHGAKSGKENGNVSPLPFQDCNSLVTSIPFFSSFTPPRGETDGYQRLKTSNFVVVRIHYIHHAFVTTLKFKLPWRVVSVIKPRTVSGGSGVSTTKLRRAFESI